LSTFWNPRYDWDIKKPPENFGRLGEPGETHIVSSPGGVFIALADFHKISL